MTRSTVEENYNHSPPAHSDLRAPCNQSTKTRWIGSSSPGPHGNPISFLSAIHNSIPTDTLATASDHDNPRRQPCPGESSHLSNRTPNLIHHFYPSSINPAPLPRDKPDCHTLTLHQKVMGRQILLSTALKLGIPSREPACITRTFHESLNGHCVGSAG
ncbi:hypothetical protein ASPWEDRAFT_40484 [Aspergillus wentii DTO 134E9]|uniref:Uncharacterized protein n=1 Tax=Aspergillus wentii DTO 134E9 TaxID=1073089 RepID=A0A1L9RK39_ASPWE|nr:uncharacterized protein ASPWEDRAFT_40484 [Aspergillus wentii DTO 134E9]OJJ35285.1 hypothetical protein ASPWEDRAFT_40484 [Aspergillus wentii DTO 134E9]